MRVLRPKGVSTGCTLRQFETSPQWPQPSQTASLIITRVRRRRRAAALALAAQLGGARLVVDQRGDAGQCRAAPAGPRRAACARAHAPRARSRAPAVAARLVADHVDPADALRLELPGQRGDRQRAGRVLTAGHRDHAVGEDLERHGGAGGHRLAHREEPRVGQRAVAHVLEAVRFAAEQRRAHPLRALAAHLGGPGGAIPREQRHAVASDPAPGHRALRDHGGAVVRAARAEVRRAGREIGRDRRSGREPVAGARDRGAAPAGSAAPRRRR